MTELLFSAEKRASERELVRLAAGGDESAQRWVVDQLFSRVRTTVHYVAGRDRDADDLVQLALVEILQSLHSYQGSCRLDVWAYRIAIRTTMKYLKRRNRRHPFASSHTGTPSGTIRGSDPLTSDSDMPDTRIDIRQLRQQLQRHLEKIPPPQRSAVVLRYVHSLELDEIAEALETPVNTVRERLRVAKKKLRHMVARDAAMGEWLERMAR